MHKLLDDSRSRESYVQYSFIFNVSLLGCEDQESASVNYTLSP